MSAKLILTILVLFITTTFSTASEVVKEREFDLTKCEEKDGIEYWDENLRQEFTDNFKEISKSDSATYWTSNNRQCFVTSNEEIADKNNQFHGYSRYLLRTYFFFKTDDLKDMTRQIVTKLNDITGGNFEDIDEFIVWHYSSSEESYKKDFEETDARSYWYHEYPGFLKLNFIKDGQFNWCYYKSIYVLSCRRINLTEIQDPEPRAKAYTQRIEYDIGQYECGASEKYMKTSNKYNIIFADKFSSFEEFHKWWYENREYLYWSNEEEKFLVDSESKKLKSPIRTFKMHVNSDLDSVANTYWSKVIRHIDDPPISDQGDFLRVCGVSAHEPYSFTVSKIYAENIHNRENGYKEFLENKIEFLLRNPEYNNPRTPEEVYFPEHILNQKFDTVEQLVIWYNENKDNLVLSEDGQKLVVKEPSD